MAPCSVMFNSKLSMFAKGYVLSLNRYNSRTSINHDLSPISLSFTSWNLLKHRLLQELLNITQQGYSVLGR